MVSSGSDLRVASAAALHDPQCTDAQPRLAARHAVAAQLYMQIEPRIAQGGGRAQRSARGLGGGRSN